VFPLHLPPLRERPVDIPLLVHFFVQRHAPRVGRHVESVDAESMLRMVNYPWPGNIRELENIVERALILDNKPVLQIHIDMPGPELTSAALPASSTPLRASGALPEPAEVESGDLDSIQREHILNVLRTANWVIEGSQGAAVRLGLKPGTLRHRMKKLGISRSVP
jgi:formate hydrogenlyase transcriptional activator